MLGRGLVGRVAAVAAGLALAAGLAAGCGSDDAAAGRPEIVATTTVLGSLTEELVGDSARVRVLMPNGVDPHDYQPSARDVEALRNADLVVENGLELEEGLLDALGEARTSGVAVFTATDHVRLREVGEGEPADDHGQEGEGDAHAEDEGEAHSEDEGAAGAGKEEDHGHGPEDPHIWMDPIAMRDAMTALAPVAERELGVDLGERPADLAARLDDLDAEIRETLAAVPEQRRKLVTGHESMGYFADRYDFEIVGTVIPSLSSQAQVSASNLAALRRQVEAEGVPAIFNEVGTPPGVADAIGDQTGARVVEIGTHNLPDDGSYFTFMREAAATVADALAQES
jgi:zinc/manganese transport system substrate-binding protein